MKLFEHQRKGVEYINKHKKVLLAWEVGTGKTLTALTVTVENNLQTIIFCPAYLVSNWNKEIQNFYPDHKHLFKVLSYGVKGDKIVNVDEKIHCLIFDESHYIKNLKAQRTLLMHKVVEYTKAEYVILLSGTPIKNRVPEFYSQLAALRDCPCNGIDVIKKYKTLWDFCGKFSNKIEKKFNGRRIIQYDGMRNIEELKQLLVDKYDRVKLIDAVDLPSFIEKHVMIKTLKDEAGLEFAFQEYLKNTKDKSYMTAKMNSAIMKAEITASYVEDITETGDRVVVFSDHIESIKKIANLLCCPVVTGATPVEERSRIFELMQSEKIKVVCGTIGAMSTGITLTKANHVVFNDIPWVSADITQAKARIYRIGQEKKCIAHFILGGPVDENIYNIVKKKNDLLTKTLEN